MKAAIGKGISISLLATVILLTQLFFSACKKNSDAPPPTPPPPAQADVIISSISPTTGPYSTVITITGSGFNANAVDNLVKFNDSTAVVQSASASQLVVVVPKRAGTGPVTVKNTAKSATGPAFNFVSTITVSTLAGTSTGGYADGTGAAAKFNGPTGVATDKQNNIYVSDASNYRIRKITPAGVVSSFAGSGVSGFADGNAPSAKFGFCYGIGVDGTGNIYASDISNARIRKITSAGVVSSWAGSGTVGFADGSGAAAKVSFPIGLVADAQGNSYLADYGNNRIRKITPDGVVSTLAGNGTFGYADGNGASAEFRGPAGVAVDPQGNIYVADYSGNRIRKVTPDGVVSTLAGSGTAGFADGSGASAQFYFPSGITLGPDGNLYVADSYNQRIRMVTPAGVVTTLAGTGTSGFAEGNGSNAQFASPFSLTTDAQGNVYIADLGNNRIRKITIE